MSENLGLVRSICADGVRCDSVQFFLPAACRDQDRLYHGTQVNNQVPPL